MLSALSHVAGASRSDHAPRSVPAVKTIAAIAMGALAVSGRAAAAALNPANAPVPAPAPATVAGGTCPALPLPCNCVAAPPAMPTAPIAQDGTPDVFVTAPSPNRDEGVQVILAQRPSGSNDTSLFALNCIDSLGDNALTSVSCVPQTLGVDQSGLLTPVGALDQILDPERNPGNGPNQLLLDYTVALKSIYDAPCTHSLLAQGLAYSLSNDRVCDLIGDFATQFNDTLVVTHFQEALRDALHTPVPRVCYDSSL